MAKSTKLKKQTKPPMGYDAVLAVVDVNELKLFANWLWDMGMIKLNTKMPPFENADKLALTYVKTRIEPRVLINEHFAKDEQIELKLLDLFGFSKDGEIMAEQQLKIFKFMEWFRTNYR
jgi:hypothetical protein